MTVDAKWKWQAALEDLAQSFFNSKVNWQARERNVKYQWPRQKRHGPTGSRGAQDMPGCGSVDAQPHTMGPRLQLTDKGDFLL